MGEKAYGSSNGVYVSEARNPRGYLRSVLDCTVSNTSATKCTVTVYTTLQYYSNNGWHVGGVQAQVSYNGNYVAQTEVIDTTDIYPYGSFPIGEWINIGTSNSYSFTIDRGKDQKTIWFGHRVRESVGEPLEYNHPADIFYAVIPPRPSYTVRYDDNGGTGTTLEQTKWYGENLTLRSNGFTRNGYSFKRWNTDPSDTGTAYNASSTYSANADLQLYAIWNRTITYNANGGSNAPSPQTDVATKAITITTAKPTRTGYTFLEWNTTPDGTGVSYNPGGTYPADEPFIDFYSITLYAIWWENPIVSITDVQRCDSNGNPKKLGDCLKVLYSWELKNGATSFTSFTVKDLVEGKAYTSSPSVSGQSGTGHVILGSGELKPDQQHAITLTYNDGHYSGTALYSLNADIDYYRPKINTAVPRLVDSGWTPDTLGKYVMVAYDYDFYKPDGSGNEGSLDTTLVLGLETSRASAALSAQSGNGESEVITETFSEPIDSETPYESNGPHHGESSGGDGLSAQSTSETTPFGPYDYDVLDPHGGFKIGTATLTDLFYSHTVDLYLDVTGYKDPYISSITARRASLVEGTLVPSDDGDQLLVELAWTVDTSSTSKQTKPSSLVIEVTEMASNLRIATRRYTGVNDIISRPSPQTAEIVYTSDLDPIDIKTGDEFVVSENQYLVTATLSDKYTDVMLESKPTRSDIVSISYFTIDIIGDCKYYNLSTDTSMDPSKSYYRRSGFGTAADPYVYTLVLYTSGNPSEQGWYEANGIKPGHGIAFGKPSQRELFDVGMNANFDLDVDVGGTIRQGGTPVALENHSHQYLPLSGGTLTGKVNADGRIRVNTDGGSWISQATPGRNAIEINSSMVTDGSRYDGILGGSITDGGHWSVGVIDNAFHFVKFNSGRTANGYDSGVILPIASGAINVGEAIKNITRSNGTFTATRANGTTFTFTQRDLVSGVKGNSESSYRTGNVNLTPANIGALPLGGGTLTGGVTNTGGNYLRKLGSFTRGTTPSANQYGAFEVVDSAGKRAGIFEIGGLTDGQLIMNLWVLGHHTSSDQYGGIQITKARANTNNAVMYFNANSGLLTTPTLTVNNDMLTAGYRVCRSRNDNGRINYIERADDYLHVETWNYGGKGVNWWSSDERMKDNIEDSNVDALEIVNQIKHRSFDMKQTGVHYDIGYIAQELEELDPQMSLKVYQTRDVNGQTFFTGDYAYQVDERKLIPYLSRAIQQLSERNAELEAKNTELEQRLEAIERSLGL